MLYIELYITVLAICVRFLLKKYLKNLMIFKCAIVHLMKVTCSREVEKNENFFYSTFYVNDIIDTSFNIHVKESLVDII